MWGSPPVAFRLLLPLGASLPCSVSGSGESPSMEFTISSASRASSSGVLRGFCAKGLGAELISVVPLASRSVSLKMHIRVKNVLDTKVKSANKFQETYADALFTASFLMPNLGGGLLIKALPPAFSASSALELLVGAELRA